MKHPVYLAEYIADGEIGNAVIRWWTGRTAPDERESHCEFIHDGWMYSSSIRDKGVRRKPCLLPWEIDWKSEDEAQSGEELIVLGEDTWRITHCPWASGQALLDHYRRTKGHPYGWLDLLASQILRRPSKDTRGDFCNEWLAMSQGIVNPREYNPGTFGDLCREFNDRYLDWSQQAVAAHLAGLLPAVP